MAILLGLDTEATSIDASTCELTEVGMVLWDTDINMPTTMYNFLVQPYGREENSEGAIGVTGITDAIRLKHGVPLSTVFGCMSYLLGKSDFLVAHNAPFDKEVILSNAKHTGDQNVESGAFHIPWIDTVEDIPYESLPKSRVLSHLAADHGFLNPFPHRALFDVMTMMRVLGEYDWEAVRAYWAEPAYELIAHVTHDTNYQAKERKFRWNPDRKLWTRVVRESALTEEFVRELPFTFGKTQVREANDYVDRTSVKST